MNGVSFLPSRLRPGRPAKPNWLSRHLSIALQAVTKRACCYPIRTIVVIAGLASTTYIGLLENSFFLDAPGAPVPGHVNRADLNSLLEGSRALRVGTETGWRWQADEGEGNGGALQPVGDRGAMKHGVPDGKQGTSADREQAAQELALLTLVFPDRSEGSAAQMAPVLATVDLPANTSARQLPSSPNPLSSLSPDTTLAFSMPYGQTSDFLIAMQEISAPAAARDPRRHDAEKGPRESKMWIMKAVKSSNGGAGGLGNWAREAWTAFVDLLKNAETTDIVIMILGYISMHLTFVSLFLSMRRLGSNFWLATTTLISGVFAFLFGLTVTTRLGVPINMRLLSEGLPFLVVTIGFEKPIVLTRALMSASLNLRRAAARTEGEDRPPLTIPIAVQNAVKERGFDIVRDYLIEIAILTAGAVSGVQGGLRQFCFLGAWILFFDCILLFTFYTAILTLKLEFNRINRHIALRKALEEDGVSKTVAENVAANNDWPRLDTDGASDDQTAEATRPTVFGRTYQDSSIPRFKLLMVSGFFIVNFLNLCSIPFRAGRNANSPVMSGLSSVVSQPPMDPFRVAGSGLDAIFESAQSQKLSTIVTVLAPIKYELEYPSVHYAGSEGSAGSFFDTEYTDQLLDGMGVTSLFKSLEDPGLTKWIIVALVISVVLNGYLFNAARWTLKEPAAPVSPPRAREVMDGAPTPMSSRMESPRLVEPLPPTPAATEDGSEEELTLELGEEDDHSRKRTYEECEQMLKAKKAPLLTDEELIALSLKGKLPGYALEKTLEDKSRAVRIRRALVSRTHATRETSTLLEKSRLPYKDYNYDLVYGACCENVVGYMPLPLGVAGPLRIDGQNYFLPMATTEGVLVASASRGCKAINAGGGVTTVLTADGMTRGPCVRFDTAVRAGEAKVWLDSEEGQRTLTAAFNSTSGFARLQSIKTALAGTNLFIRFKATTGDAMGMNMISKGVEHALRVMTADAGFADMDVVSLSGNFCIDKKAAALNWIDGRGKSVVAEALIPGDLVRSVLKTDVNTLVDLNTRKNLIGSAMAGSIGGFNAHASNLVAAIFIATGQDPAQVVESSNCMTLMHNNNGNLQISVSMPSIEVGTIGGGTVLEPQAAMLDLLGVRGAHPTHPGEHARRLARVIAAAVLAGELSLCSALAAGHLVKAHLSHNRSAQPSRAPTPVAGQQEGARGLPTLSPSAADLAAGGSGGGGGGHAGTMTPTSLAMTATRERTAR